MPMNLSQIKEKYYSDIDDADFQWIVGADPTYRTEKPEKKGRYTMWLLNLFRSGSLTRENDYKATQYLRTFDRCKQRLEQKDIGQYRSLPDLYDAVKPYLDSDEPISRKELKAEEATKVYEDDEWMVVVPHTWDASKLYGSHTQWCTASRYSNSYFLQYTRLGELYINIRKATQEKYQMFATGREKYYQYCFDATDRQVSAENIGLTAGLQEYYNTHFTFGQRLFRAPEFEQVGLDRYRSVDGVEAMKVVPLNWSRVCQIEQKDGARYLYRQGHPLFSLAGVDAVRNHSARLQLLWRNKQCSLLDTDLVEHSDSEYLAQHLRYSSGLTPVLTQKGANYIDEQGRLAFGDYNFRECGQFSEGLAPVVTVAGVRRYINEKCEVVLAFENANVGRHDPFHNGWAQIRERNSFNLIDHDGNRLLPNNVKEIEKFETNGVALVNYGDGGLALVDWRGSEIAPGMRFRKVYPFRAGMARVMLKDGTWNYLQADGNLLLKRGVDVAFDFSPATLVAEIRTYRGTNYVNTDGQLLFPKWQRNAKV